MNNDFWKNKIRAFLHDPPDKAIRIQDHEKRRNEILGTELKFRKDRGIGRTIALSDETSASLQRIDLEKVNNKRLSSIFYKKHSENYILVGEPILRHPITGDIKNYETTKSILPDLPENSESEYDEKFNEILELLMEAEKYAFNNIIKLNNNHEKIYFTLWRYYPKLLKKKVAKKFKERCEFEELCRQLAEEFVNLTAYTLSPDHTLFDHADATSAIYGAIYEERKPALLMFKISPVRDFIKNARKERDLWASSHLLSFLTFQAIKVIIDKFGPDAIIFPHLRGQPFFDKEYEDKFKDVPDEVRIKNIENKLKIANIPNRFLAIVGFKEQEEINDLKNEIESTIKDTICKIFNYAWSETITSDILEQVRNELKEKAKGKDKEKYEKALSELDRLSGNYYQRLAEEYFQITLEVLEVPFDSNELGTDKAKSYEILENFVKGLKLPKDVERKYLDWLNMLKSFGTHPARIFDLYSLMFEILEEIVGIESRKFEKVEGESAYKCSLCGELEAIGGRDYILMRVLWSKIREKDPILFKKNEHLCPICLVKRLYHKWLNEFKDDKKKKWNIKAGFESVSEVALKKRSGFIKDDGNKTIELTHLDILRDGDILKLEEAKKNDEKLNVEKVRKLRNKYNYLDKIFKEFLAILIINVYKNKLLPKELSERPITNSVEFFYKEKLTFDNLLEEYGFPRFDEIKKEIEDINTLKEIEQKKAYIESIISKIKTLLDELPFEPEKYYSILIMDGDNMGKMLVGDEMKPVKDYLHPEVLKYLPPEAKEKVEKTKRLITPATHSAISRALMHFSVNKVSDIVENYRGELIYAGGDDILALLPIDSTLACAYEIQNLFGKDWDGWELLPAKKMSAGILIVHYKHPLYDALDKARSLEKKAKELGRNAVAVGYLARSGTYNEVVFNWNIVPKLGKFVELIKNSEKDEKPSLSKRIIYHVTQEVDALPNDEKALKEYLKYELSRHYKGDEKADDLADEIISLAKNVRVMISDEDFTDFMIGDKIKRSLLNRINSEILGLVSKDDLTCGKLYDRLKTLLQNYLKGNNCDFYEKLYGLILKKQIKSLFNLLKILVDCDAELGGGSYEDSDRT